MSLSSQVDELASKYEAVVVHVKSHANFRGEIKKLSPECVICKKYFAESLGV